MAYAGPYNNLPKPNNRIGILKTYYYNKNGQLLWWNGKRSVNKAKRKEYNKEYQQENKAKAKEKRDKPKNKAKAKEKRDKPANKARKKEYDDKPGRKAKVNKKHKDRMKTDLSYKLTRSLIARHWAGLKSQNVEPTIPVLELMECSFESLIIHLVSKFEPGMTRENYGNKSGCWNIDHRRCYDSLKLKDIENQRKCCHWTNLQPMWKTENRAKSNHFDEATFEYKWIDTNLGWIKK